MSGETSRRESRRESLLELLPSDGLDEGRSRCGLWEERNPGVLRGDPVMPVFVGDRATGGGRRGVREPLRPLRKSAGPGPLPAGLSLFLR